MGHPRDGCARVGGFELGAELGRGAAGTVYRARDPALGRDVALKFLSRLDPAQLERFRREVTLTARLIHPGIVRVHGVHEADGRPFMVCELIEQAQPLDHAFRTRDLVPRIALLGQAAHALGHAHRHGVVHRDVKPDNVLVDAEGQARVTDFGVAFEETAERLTRTGALVGTPLYMAPEQISGERGAIGPPTDVWALGVLLVQACTDRLPFNGSSLVTLSAEILEQRPPRLSGPARSLQPLVDRALAKDPGDRYPTGEALAVEIDAWLARRLEPARAGKRSLTVAALALAVTLVSVALVASARPGPPVAPLAKPPRLGSSPAGAAARPTLAPGRGPTESPDPPSLTPRHVAQIADGAGLRVPAWDGESLLVPTATGVRRFSPRGEPGRLLPLRLGEPAGVARLGTRWVVAASDAEQLLVFDGDLRAATPLIAAAHTERVLASPSGTHVATVEAGRRRLRLIDVEGRLVAQLDLGVGETIQAAAFTHDGERLLLATGGAASELGDWSTLTVLQVADGAQADLNEAGCTVRNLAIGPEGQLALGAREGGLLLADPDSTGLGWESPRNLSPRFPPGNSLLAIAHPGGVGGLAWTPSGQLYSGPHSTLPGIPPRLRVWAGDRRGELAAPCELSLDEAWTRDLQISPSGSYLAVTHNEEALSVFSIGR